MKEFCALVGIYRSMPYPYYVEEFAEAGGTVARERARG